MKNPCRYLYVVKYLFFVLLLFSRSALAQQGILVNMSPIDGVLLSPANIFNYQINASKTEKVTIQGIIRFRGSDMSMSYSYDYLLRDGVNIPGANVTNAQWQFSTSVLRELFFMYNSLPVGTFEYCVKIQPSTAVPESSANDIEECLYHRNDGFFLINLIDPADRAKLKEFNPLLSWVANCSFASELTYRIRIAEVKKGQNAINAMLHNLPIFEEKGLIRNSLTYPVYARPLAVNQPYAWTVDAYYKNILLGGSETWQFIIVDTAEAKANRTLSYVDIKKESGLVMLSALGNLKLKYILDDAQQDSLYLEIQNEKGKKRSLSPSTLKADYGDNRYNLDLAANSNLKHKAVYVLIIKTKTGHEYKLTFLYLNPDFQN